MMFYFRKFLSYLYFYVNINYVARIYSYVRILEFSPK